MTPMRALIFDSANPGEVVLADVPAPEPAASEALVRVAATSLNFADVAFRPGRDAAGTA